MGKYKVIISGGGTGGHIFPAIAIANELKEQLQDEIEILFIGAETKMEMKLVPQAGYKIVGLPIKGIQRKITFQNILKNLTFVNFLLVSLIKARNILKNFKPDCVIGTGGFASAPVVYMANKLKIPTIIQEQNSVPGLVNKILAKKVSKICTAYEETLKFFPKEKTTITGNPIRKEISLIENKNEDALKYFNFKKEDNILLIIGGSLGAFSINNSIYNGLERLQEQNIKIIWQVGKLFYKIAKEKASENIVVLDFIDKMDYAYSVSDIIVARAGAITISELCILAKPTIIVPSPNVANDHQNKNAQTLLNKNAIILVKDDEAKFKLIDEVIKLNKNIEQRFNLSKNIKMLQKPNATKDIVREVLTNF